MTFPRTFILTAGAALATGLALAHPHPRPEVQLTPEQRDQIGEMRDRARAEGLSDAAMRSREAQRELRRLMRDTATSEAALRDAFQRAAMAREEAFVLRRKARAEAMSVLTEEQRKAFEQRRSLRRGHRRHVL